MTDFRGYVRLSQSGRERSIQEQIDDLFSYAEEKEIPLTEDQIFNDGENASGFDCERDEFQQLITELKDDRIEGVVLRDRARLSRDFDTRMKFITAMRQTATEFHVVEEGREIDLQDVQVAGMEATHAAMDHFKKQQEIERARRAVQERVDNEEVDHGRPRFGMTYDEDGRYQIPGDDFEKVETMLRMREEGASLAEISDAVDVAEATVWRVLQRREWYEERACLEN